MKHLIALCLLLASAAVHAATDPNVCQQPVTFPDGTRPVCSVTFALQAPCSGGEMVYSWNISGPNGAYPKGQWQIRPWLNASINIVRVELLELYVDGHAFFMVGDNSQGDPMLYLGPAEYHAHTNFPDGTSWMFPSVLDAKPNDYIDLHGLCGAGRYADVRLTFFYTVSP